jgi:hypothetical protein
MARGRPKFDRKSGCSRRRVRLTCLFPVFWRRSALGIQVADIAARLAAEE